MSIRIAVVLIATGKQYFEYAVRLAPQIHFFFPTAPKTVFLLTNVLASDVPGVNEVLAIEHLPSPLPTLLRYHWIHKFREKFVDYTHVYYLDVDVEIVRTVSDEILSPIVAVRHWVWPLRELAHLACYETRPQSKAFVDKKQAIVYVAGAFQGGERAVYLNVVKELRDDINTDLNRGFGEEAIVALWHDESHWNRWVNANIDAVRVLPPEYMAGEPSHSRFPGALGSPIISCVPKDRVATWQWSDEPAVAVPSLEHSGFSPGQPDGQPQRSE